MKAQATALGHPIHPMLIVFPLGLFPVAVIFDLIYWFGGHNPRWARGGLAVNWFIASIWGSMKVHISTRQIRCPAVPRAIAFGACGESSPDWLSGSGIRKRKFCYWLRYR